MWLFIILYVPVFVFGETPSVVINEIAWMGSPMEEVNSKNHWRYEWLELYNTSTEPVSLKGWSVELMQGDKVFTIPLQGSIGPEGYFLAASSDQIKGADVNYKTLAGVFSNSGQKVVVRDTAKKIIDETDWQSGWPAGDNDIKLTMERVDAEGSSKDPLNWQTSLAIGGTPKAQNSDQSVAGKAAEDVHGKNSTVFKSKEDSFLSSLFGVLTAKPFMIALLLSLAFALSLALLKRVVAQERELEE